MRRAPKSGTAQGVAQSLSASNFNRRVGHIQGVSRQMALKTRAFLQCKDAGIVKGAH